MFIPKGKGGCGRAAIRLPHLTIIFQVGLICRRKAYLQHINMWWWPLLLKIINKLTVRLNTFQQTEFFHLTKVLPLLFPSFFKNGLRGFCLFGILCFLCCGNPWPPLSSRSCRRSCHACRFFHLCCIRCIWMTLNGSILWLLMQQSDRMVVSYVKMDYSWSIVLGTTFCCSSFVEVEWWILSWKHYNRLRT